MSKISLLPEIDEPLTGEEPVVLVHGGRAKQGPIGELVEQLAQPFVEQAKEAATDAVAVGASDSFPQLYADPELEYLSVGDTQAWGASALTVVTQGGAKRLRTPPFGVDTLVIDTSTRHVPVASFATGRVSASVVVARKDATTAGAMKLRLLAFDASNALINWTDASGNDDPTSSGNYGRNLEAAAITVPTEVIIAQNVQLPAGTVKVALAVRCEAGKTLDFSHTTLRDGGNPHYVAPRLSPKQVADTVAAVSTIRAQDALSYAPNLYVDPELEYAQTGTIVSWSGVNLTVVTQGGSKRLRTPVVSGAAIGGLDTGTIIPVSAFPSGRVSASVIVARKDASTASDLRLRIVARDSGGNQLNWPSYAGADEGAGNVYSRYMPAGEITTPTEVIIGENVELPVGTATVRVQVRCDGAPTMDFSHLCIRDGADPHYRSPRISPKQVADNTATLANLPAEDAPTTAVQWPNAFTANELDAVAMSTGAAGSGTFEASTFGAGLKKCWLLSAPIAAATEVGVFFGFKTRAVLDNGSGILSAAVQVLSADAFEGVGTTKLIRLLVIQRNSAGTEISAARTTINLTTGVGGISSPQWSRRSDIALHADAATVGFYIGISNQDGTSVRSVRFSDMLLAPGNNATFRRPLPASISGAGVVFVGPTGSDSAAGTAGAPMATAQAAVNKLGGAGTVVFLYGVYRTLQQIDPATVTGPLSIVGRRSTSATGYDSYPVLYASSQLDGITKTLGRTKVYQCALSGLTAANFNWLWQDGAADPRTLIGAGERFPHHRGRLNRLHWGTKLVKATATTLSEALTEIDAAGSDDPRAFYDEATGTAYFAIVGGGDASAADIYMPGTSGLFGSGGWETAPRVSVLGIEQRYGSLDTRAFRSAELEEVFVYGSRGNCIDYSTLSYRTLECAGAGAGSGLIGDGLNGHVGAKISSGIDYYGHDCRDDAYSDHEGSSSRLDGGLVEFNGGTGCAPAYGADDVIRHFISHKNQQRGTYKKAGFYATGAPSSGASGGDGGADTLAVFMDCISIGDIVGFADDRATSSNAVRAVTIRCAVNDNSGSWGYDVAEMRDCGWASGTGIARRLDGGATTVKNTTLVA